MLRAAWCHRAVGEARPLRGRTRGGRLFSTSSFRRRRQKGRSSSPAFSSCARSTLGSGGEQ